MKRLRVCYRVMTSHDTCTEASLQRFKMEALNPTPADCEVRSVIKFLNAQSIAPIEIHRQLCQQSFPADFPLLVAQNCHGVPVVEKIVHQVGAKATDTRTHSKAHGVSIDNEIVVHISLHLKKFLYGQRQRFQNDREAEMSVTLCFQSQAADFYETGIQKLIPRNEKYLNSAGEFVET